MIVFKAIKPERLKEDVFRLAMLSVVNGTARDIKKDFEATTKTWHHKPVFVVMVSLKGGPTAMVDTDDEIYGWVNNGTPEHIILPKNKKVLSYLGTFTPKTIPGNIMSRAGGKTGTRVYRSGVLNPGIEARNFDKVLSEKWQPIFKGRVEKAMAEVAKKANSK